MGAHRAVLLQASRMEVTGLPNHSANATLSSPSRDVLVARSFSGTTDRFVRFAPAGHPDGIDGAAAPGSTRGLASSGGSTALRHGRMMARRSRKGILAAVASAAAALVPCAVLPSFKLLTRHLHDCAPQARSSLAPAILWPFASRFARGSAQLDETPSIRHRDALGRIWSRLGGGLSIELQER